MEKQIIEFFTGMSGIEEVIESAENGFSGGVFNYSVAPNNGVFDKEFLKKFVNINQGDNDYDYELGRLGYEFLSSDDGVKKLAEKYLSLIQTCNSKFISIEVIANCNQSLIDIAKS